MSHQKNWDFAHHHSDRLMVVFFRMVHADKGRIPDIFYEMTNSAAL